MGNQQGPNKTALPRPCAPYGFCQEVAAVHTAEGAIRTATLAAMERYNIVLGFLNDAPANVDAWARTASAKFLPSPAIVTNASGLSPGIDDLRQWYKSGRFRGMGEIATQYGSIPPNDPRLEPYFALAEELDLPVLIHTAGLGAPVPGFAASFGRPMLLEDVVKRHPKLRIYFENAGYPYLDEAITLMTQYESVYADVSTITWIIPRPAFDRYLRGLVDAGLGSRLMYGSDQMQWPEVIGAGIERIESATYLDAATKRAILYDNAARFLRLGKPSRPSP